MVSLIFPAEGTLSFILIMSIIFVHCFSPWDTKSLSVLVFPSLASWKPNGPHPVLAFETLDF
jgi:hypothetical protein